MKDADKMEGSRRIRCRVKFLHKREQFWFYVYDDGTWEVYCDHSHEGLVYRKGEVEKREGCSMAGREDLVPLWNCSRCRSTNVKFVRTNVDFNHPEAPPDVDIVCLDCGQESVGFGIPEEELSEIRDLLKKAGTPISEDVDGTTIVRALYDLVKKSLNGETGTVDGC